MIRTMWQVASWATAGKRSPRGVAVGLCGAVLGGGPIVGTALGLGTGYVALRRDRTGVVGVSVRRMGNFVVRQQGRLSKFEGEHHYLERTNHFLTSLWLSSADKVNACLHTVAPYHEKKDSIRQTVCQITDSRYLEKEREKKGDRFSWNVITTKSMRGNGSFLYDRILRRDNSFH